MEIDEGSRLGREVLAGGARYSAGALPDDDAMAGFYELACERLAAAGYVHYEISNWAVPGRESQHNLKYWRREPYLGLGAGAHSFDGARRWANAHHPAEYIECVSRGQLPREQCETLSRRQVLEEELFLGLRLREGIEPARIESQYNVSLAPRIEHLRAQGLVELDERRVRVAESRLAVANEVIVQLLEA
jgi:oxygen-independent coproporphyrinogen-3 oxidase